VRVNIITNLANGVGLQRDYELLKRMLEQRGHVATGVAFDNPRNPPPPADYNIFIEVLVPEFMQFAPNNWIIPNSEWWFGHLWDRHLPLISKVLCKTKDGLRIWRAKVGDRAIYLGFESSDFFRAEIPREKKFLHVAGKSLTKNTATVMDAWRGYKIEAPLTVVSFHPDAQRVTYGVPNVTYYGRLAEETLIGLMNSHLFHLCPSKSEGFGHYIHEALSCGGLVLTTNAPPMNEFAGIDKELLIPVVAKERMREAMANLVSPAGIQQTVARAMSLPMNRITDIHNGARAAYLSERDEFRRIFDEVFYV